MSAHQDPTPPGGASACPRSLRGFEVHVRTVPDGIRLLTLIGEIDLLFLRRFQAVLLDELGGRAKIVVVDLTRVDFMAAGAVGVLAGAQRRAASRHVELHLAGAQRMVHRVFELTGLTALVPCHASLPDTLRLLSRAGQG